MKIKLFSISVAAVILTVNVFTASAKDYVAVFLGYKATAQRLTQRLYS